MERQNADILMKCRGEKYDSESQEVSTIPPAANRSQLFSKKLLTWGVEARGIHPVAIEDRTETQFIKIFFIWLSANASIVTFSAGTLGPVSFGLGLRDSCLVILFFNLVCAIPPAYLATWGPKLGLRQLCASRYTFGYYGAMVPSLLAIALSMVFCFLGCIIGGQALASISNLSWTVGIIIISATSLFISFCGIKVLNWYENCAWIPALIVFAITAGVGGSKFVDVPVAPATTAQILNFGATVAGSMITWGIYSSDYFVYFHYRASSWRVFAYSYLGLSIPTITVECLGAAAALSASSIPAWNTGYTDGNVGGLINAMLFPLGKFGKFLVVLLSLSATANNAPMIYSMCLGFQTLIPPLVAVPRYVLSVFATALITFLAILGQHTLYATLSNFYGIIGYWGGAWVSAVCVEHLYFRRGDFSRYDLQYWDVPSRLPLGAAALGASVLSFALVIPCMSQVWYQGAIASKTGDLGFESAMVVTALCYVPLRHLEMRWRGI